MSVSGEIVLLFAYGLARLAPSLFESADLLENGLFAAMAQPVQPLFDPRRRFKLVPAMAGPSQFPQVLATMPEIQQLPGLWPPVGFEIPNPSNAVAQHQLVLGSSQSPTQRFPVQTLPQFHRPAQAAHHDLLRDEPATPFRPGGLLVQVKHPVLNFVPFYAVLLGPLLPPARAAETRKPTIQHQQREFGRPPLGLALPSRFLQPLLGLGLRHTTNPLH